MGSVPEHLCSSETTVRKNVALRGLRTGTRLRVFEPLRLLVVGLSRGDHIGGLWNEKTQAEQVKPGATEE